MRYRAPAAIFLLLAAFTLFAFHRSKMKDTRQF
jgi:hypothetical protein